MEYLVLIGLLIIGAVIYGFGYAAGEAGVYAKINLYYDDKD